ncbi:MAG: phage scaffolding protein [Raoultibacter sp.]
MKKEDLVKLGLTDEIAGKVAQAFAEELKGYIPKARFDELNEVKKKADADLKERDGQLETLRTSTGDVEALRAQIAQLQTDNKAKDDQHAEEVKQLKIENAVSAALTEAKAKNLKAAKALLDLTKAELNDDGTVKGLGDQIVKLKGSDDSKFMFDVGKTKPVIKGAKLSESGNEDEDKGVDTGKMTYEELAAYMESNPDAQI